MALGFYHRIEADPHDDDGRPEPRPRPSTAWSTPSRSATGGSRSWPSGPSSSPRSWPRIGRLASGIAHEINNPLTGVLTYSSLLLEDMKGTKYEEDLKVIRDETLRCRGIVRGILDFARDTKPEKAPADLNAIIEDSPAHPGEARQLPERRRSSRRLDPGLPAGQRGRRARSGRSSTTWPSTPPTPCPNGGRLTITTGREPETGHGRHPRRGHGRRHQPGEPGQDLRAVLHDQGPGQGDGARAGHDLRRHPAPRRHDRRPEQGRRGDGIHHQAAAAAEPGAPGDSDMAEQAAVHRRRGHRPQELAPDLRRVRTTRSTRRRPATRAWPWPGPGLRRRRHRPEDARPGRHGGPQGPAEGAARDDASSSSPATPTSRRPARP